MWGLGWPGPKDLKGRLLAAPGWLWEGPATTCSSTRGVCQPWPARHGEARAGDSPHSTTLLPTPALCLCLNCGSCRRTCSHSYFDYILTEGLQCKARPVSCITYNKRDHLYPRGPVAVLLVGGVEGTGVYLGEAGYGAWQQACLP